MLLWDLLWSSLQAPLALPATTCTTTLPGIPAPNLVTFILENIDLPHGLPGLAIASPSTHSPNYYYHWVRDGAITIDALVDTYNSTSESDLRNTLGSTIDSYLKSSAVLQTKHTQSGLGEPKFYIDGSPFNGNWGRPQNDGPALRAMVSAKWATLQGTLAENWPYIQTDLEYITQNWGLAGFDLWEELYGYHFFTSAMQYGAMKVGAHVAGTLHHHDDEKRYAQIADQIAKFIHSSFFPGRFDTNQYVAEHFPPNLGGREGLDAATVLAVLELESLAGWTGLSLEFGLKLPAIKASVYALLSDFTTRFPINKGRPGGIGRYPEDEYDGVERAGGNPWFICTAAVAEALIAYGDSRYQNLLEFINAHRGDTLSEQMDANTGYMRGAANLTWSYSSVLRAERAAGERGSTVCI